MNVGTNGVVVDQHGNVLLIKRNDTRTFAPPGGALEAGELPPDGAAREVREETGLIVLPVRLTTLTYIPFSPYGFLNFTFRCLLRGGEIASSEESPVVGFFKPNPLPRRMAGFHRERLENGLSHAEERPLFFQNHVSMANKIARFLLRQVVYRWFDLKRKLQGVPPFQPSPPWSVFTYLLYANDAQEYLWHRPQDNGPWQLPGGRASGLQAPWQTAVQLAQQQTGLALQPRSLSDVYLGPQENQLHLIFIAEKAPQQPLVEQTTVGWFKPENSPATSEPHHQRMLTNSRQNNQPTRFHSLLDE